MYIIRILKVKYLNAAKYNLKNLLDILTALKGKTHKGQDAITKFLGYYKEDVLHFYLEVV